MIRIIRRGIKQKTKIMIKQKKADKCSGYNNDLHPMFHVNVLETTEKRKMLKEFLLNSP